MLMKCRGGAMLKETPAVLSLRGAVWALQAAQQGSHHSVSHE